MRIPAGSPCENAWKKLIAFRFDQYFNSCEGEQSLKPLETTSHHVKSRLIGKTRIFLTENWKSLSLCQFWKVFRKIFPNGSRRTFPTWIIPKLFSLSPLPPFLPPPTDRRKSIKFAVFNFSSAWMEPIFPIHFPDTFFFALLEMEKCVNCFFGSYFRRKLFFYEFRYDGLSGMMFLCRRISFLRHQRDLSWDFGAVYLLICSCCAL